MDKAVELFNLSYWRAHESRVSDRSFMDSFYERFVGASAEVRELFANTDMAAQKDMLMLSLVHVASYTSEDGPSATLERLAPRHAELGVKPHLYGLWLECLIQALAEHDPEYDADVDRSWRVTLGPGIAYMMSLCRA